jgi:site-specific recombinase XerD
MAPLKVSGNSEEAPTGLPEPWGRLLAGYLIEKELVGRSHRTPHEYGRIVGRFLAGVSGPSTVTPLDVELFAYGGGVTGATPSGSTICVRLAAISGLYELAVQNGLVARNPAALVRRPRATAPLPRGPEPEAIRLILAAIPDTSWGRRDRAIVLIILLCGLRRSEVLGLTAGQVDLRTGEFLSHVKGGRERRRVMPEPALAALRSALAGEGRLAALDPAERLFRVSGGGFAKNLRGYASAAGVPGVSPHALRHSAAKLRRLAGASIEDVSAMLGHRSLSTTAIYLSRLETEVDAGWEGAAAALGLSSRVAARRGDRGTSAGERPRGHSVAWADCRAGPVRWRTTGRTFERPSGPSDRSGPREPHLPVRKPTAADKR